MKKIFIYLSITIFALTSCGGSSEENNTVNDSVEVCTYSYDSASTLVTWTAFKLTEKIGVTGNFDQVNVVAKNDVSDMFETLIGATFDIPVSSLNSQDPVRDPKIKNSFFGNMVETSSITGTVTTINSNSASIAVTMNGVTKDYEGFVTVAGEKITVTTTIDIVDFEAQTALDSLGVVCAEKHTGPDGINKFWTTVDVAVQTTLIKNCK